MRILHTSDWHLGQTLHGVGREHEHGAFLDWLLEVVGERGVDAVLVAGDVFDTANPPAQAQAAWYRFLAAARERYPALDLVVIGGNHDSSARLDAPGPMLDALRIRVVGGLPRLPGGALDLDRLLVPLRDAGGETAAWVAAVPFLRPADLPAEDGGRGDPLVEGVRAVYAEALAEARRRRRGSEGLVAMGHCYLAQTALSELSERKILGGNQHALPPDLFPGDLAYAALGHLHLAQRVGGDDRIRYSGAPLPLALSESGYPHQVCLVDLDGEGLLRPVRVESLRVPRAVEILHVPGDGPRPLAEVLGLLAALPEADPAVPEAARPYLEVRVLLEAPAPALRREVEAALTGKAPRLLKITAHHTGHGQALGPAPGRQHLRDFSPEEVFLQCYRRSHEGDPSADLLAAFHELLEDVERGEGA
ncbi:MAG: exonuclease SbcCD subunit D C-terminal domain-containing protein [Thermodesulfobacteriota bacterium]